MRIEPQARLDGVIVHELEQLWRLRLLEGEEPEGEGLTRGTLLRRTSLLAALTLPAAASVLAPAALASASCIPSGSSVDCPEGPNSECCSGRCAPGLDSAPGRCCSSNGSPCSTDDECCSHSCFNGNCIAD